MAWRGFPPLYCLHRVGLAFCGRALSTEPDTVATCSEHGIATAWGNAGALANANRLASIARGETVAIEPVQCSDGLLRDSAVSLAELIDAIDVEA